MKNPLLLLTALLCFLAAETSRGAVYYYNGILNSLWNDDATWGPDVSGYPNAQGDIATNELSVSTNVFQNVSAGVTVGTINHNPSSPANAGPGVDWRITTNNPITLDQDGAGPGSAQISITQLLKTNSLTIDGAAGLFLADNLSITNLNPNGGVINIATNISGGPSGNDVSVTGPGLVKFSHATTYQGTTTINPGTLEAAATGALGGTSAITVNGGGTLLLSGLGNDRIGNAAPLNLSGGTLAMNGVSEGAPGTTGVGALSLLTTSTIDFASGLTSSVVQFAGVGTQTDGQILQIANWNGNIYFGGGSERLLFAGNDATDPNTFSDLYSQNEVTFNGLPGYHITQFEGFYEVAALPEPSTWIGAALALAAVGFTQRRRFAKRSRVVG